MGKLRNFHQVDTGVYRSEQPGSTDFFEFEKTGIREVINLRRLRNDRKKAKNTKLALHHIPMKAAAINNAEVMKALTLIRDRKGPVLIHCWHGSDRTGMLVAMYRMVFQDWTKDDAINEMTKGNFGFHSVYQNIVTYVRAADISAIKKELFVQAPAAGKDPATTVASAR
ncbi:protein tyrosine phosphatase [Pedobacter sp. HMF7056]|uniref:Protein tyrosine phosphatase n=2 Tax=Hufsiella ginkgonis TaxID=2695274 RepID=A0A7K1XSD0_9SPHI|nr:protein tyrosine phosphatase [Hufsiella ginkgonis]